MMRKNFLTKFIQSISKKPIHTGELIVGPQIIITIKDQYIADVIHSDETAFYVYKPLTMYKYFDAQQSQENIALIRSYPYAKQPYMPIMKSSVVSMFPADDNMIRSYIEINTRIDQQQKALINKSEEKLVLKKSEEEEKSKNVHRRQLGEFSFSEIEDIWNATKVTNKTQIH